MASERFIRWQRYTIEQLTFALNLFLALSGASLAFGLTLLQKESFTISGCSRFAFSFGLTSLTLSVVVGCGAVISRLLDFRFTARTVRADEKQNSESEAGVYRYHSKVLGDLTWRLFWLEVATFAFGVIGLIVTLSLKYGNKLW